VENNFLETVELNTKHYYKNSANIKDTINEDIEYFPISVESLQDIIQSAIDAYNADVELLIQHNIEYVLGNNLGRPIEFLISKYMHLNDANLQFRQGCESNEADLTCIDNDNYSIELKTSKTLIKDPIKCRPIITGNVSYAKDKQDETSKKSKSHYYILINYEYIDYKITNYKAWFGFIEQSDWLIPNKGAASKLDINNIKVQQKIIKLYE
jgi:hypothetical protein